MMRYPKLTAREKAVAQDFEMALNILKRLPPVKVPGFITIWPEFVYSKRELRQQRAETQAKRLGVSRPEMDKLSKVQNWILVAPENTRKILWLRAARLSWRNIGNYMRLGPDMVQRLWIFAINEILRWIEKKQKQE